MAELLLAMSAIGIWLIWYELRYGVESRKENRRVAQRFRKELKEKSDMRWKEFTEARRNDKSWVRLCYYNRTEWVWSLPEQGKNEI